MPGYGAYAPSPHRMRGAGTPEPLREQANLLGPGAIDISFCAQVVYQAAIAPVSADYRLRLRLARRL